MDRAAPAGLEVKPSMGPEVIPPPDSYKYYAEAPDADHRSFPPQDQSNQFEAKSKSRHKALWALVVLAVVCLAVALGAGLGAGLAAQHKPSGSA